MQDLNTRVMLETHRMVQLVPQLAHVASCEW